MLKLATIAALVALLSACSSMPGSMSDNSGMSRSPMGNVSGGAGGPN